MFLLLVLYFLIIAPNRGSVLAGNTGGVYTLIGAGIWSLLILTLLFLVYRDADDKFGSGCFWGVIIVFFDFLGLIIYVLLREQYTKVSQSTLAQMNIENIQRNKLKQKEFYNLYDNRLVSLGRRDDEIERIIAQEGIEKALKYSKSKLNQTDSDIDHELIEVYTEVLEEEWNRINRPKREDEWC